MMSKAKISCRVEATAPGLTLCARVDDTIIFQGDAHDQHDLTIEIDDDERPHVLIFELAGKTQEHTKLDQSGMIISDVVVNISDLSFDGIALGHTFVEKAIYSHDNNGTGAQVQEKFYGTMGCNGTVRLEFTAPIYLWLLENM